MPRPPPESSQAMRRERRSASCWICAAVPGRRLHQSPDMRQERESAKLAREQLVPAVGQRARRKPMGQPARLVSMVVLKALAQQVPVSTQSVRLTMRPALVQTQPVRCLQTLHMPGKIVPAYQLYFRSGRSTPSCASLPQIGLIAIASMLLFSITPQPYCGCFDAMSTSSSGQRSGTRLHLAASQEAGHRSRRRGRMAA